MRRFSELLFIMLPLSLVGCRDASDTKSPTNGANAISTDNADWIDYYRVPDAQGRPFADTDIAAIVNDLKSGEWTVRLRAANAVPWRGGGDFGAALVPLVDALHSEHSELQVAAASAISNIAAGAIERNERIADFELALDPLMKIAQGPHSEECRRWAIMALGGAARNLGGNAIAQTIPVFTKTLRDPVDQIFRRSVEGLAGFGPAASTSIPDIIIQLDQGGYRAMMAATALQQIHSEPGLCVPALIRALKRLDAPQKRIADALAEFGSASKEAVEELIPLLSNGDGNVVIAAANALARIGADAAAEPLGHAYTNAKNRREVKVACLTALAMIGPSGEHVAVSAIQHERQFVVSNSGFSFPLPPKLLTILATAPKLERLDLNDSGFGDESLPSLSKMLQVRELLLPKSTTDHGLACVAELTQLQLLQIGNGVTDEGLNLIEKLQRLRRLKIDSPSVTDDGLKSLRSLANLLVLQLPKSVSGTGLKHLSASTQLQELVLPGATDRGLQSLSKFSALRKLTVHGRSVTDEGMAHFVGVKKLEDLSLRHTAISDSGVALIARHLPQLRKLNLNHCAITAACVPELCRLRELEFLGVYNTSLAGQRDVLNMSQTTAVQTLRRSLPQCEVMYAD